MGRFNMTDFELENLKRYVQLADLKMKCLTELVKYYKFKSEILYEPIEGMNFTISLLERELKDDDQTTSETCNEEKQAMDIKEAENKVASLIRNNPKNAL